MQLNPNLLGAWVHSIFTWYLGKGESIFAMGIMDKSTLDFKALPVFIRVAFCNSWIMFITLVYEFTTFVLSSEQSSAMVWIRRRLFGKNCSTSLGVPWSRKKMYGHKLIELLEENQVKNLYQFMTNYKIWLSVAN